MSAVPGQDDLTQIDEFFNYLYGGEEGYVYIGRKNPKDFKNFKQDFFEWPKQRVEVAEFVLQNRAKWEVYMAPALFDEPKGTKANVKGARVFWCEFDVTPSLSDRLPKPTLRVSSGGEGHEHWYWKLDTFVGPDELDSVNRAITYLMGADTSGWDAGQILRPVCTFNHKRQRDVSLLEVQGAELPKDLFSGLPQPPPPVEIKSPDEIPDVTDVVMAFNFSGRLGQLFKDGHIDRSKGLMELGYLLAEHNMSNEEMLAVLLNADERWGKFQGRHDRVKRLLEIVTIARQKHPLRSSVGDDEEEPRVKLAPMGFLTLLRTEVHLEWVWDNFLQSDGYMLVTGPSAIGKTQLTLDFAAHLTNGLPFLEQNVKPSKVGLLSLEMGLTDVKHFLLTLQAAYSQEQQQVMEEMLQIFPLGEPLYMANDLVLKEVDQLIGDLKLNGLMIDSLGQATEEALSDEAFRKFFHKMSKLRKRHKCFMWFIHHNRKANGDNKKPNKLADVFGSQYITSEATTVLGLWKGQYANSIEVSPLKVRLAKTPDPFHIHRDQNLHFTLMTPGVAKPLPETDSDESGHSEQDQTDSQSSDPFAGGAFTVDMGQSGGKGLEFDI